MTREEATKDIKENILSTEPTRTFVELVVKYPDPELCTYKEYKGKPYYSIKYIENGETYVGYGTYNPKVLSQYLKEYFISSAQPECEDAVNKNVIIQKLNTMDRYVSEELRLCGTDKKFPKNEVFIVDDVYEEIVENLPSVTPKQWWIPCRERLPDREMPVWVSMCDDDVLKAIWRNGWCAPNGHKIGLTDGQVIAWMPRQIVPEPYREVGGDK